MRLEGFRKEVDDLNPPDSGSNIVHTFDYIIIRVHTI